MTATVGQLACTQRKLTLTVFVTRVRLGQGRKGHRKQASCAECAWATGGALYIYRYARQRLILGRFLRWVKVCSSELEAINQTKYLAHRISMDQPR